jgi:hypothetical protein
MEERLLNRIVVVEEMGGKRRGFKLVRDVRLIVGCE